jgi:hypothetical protein
MFRIKGGIREQKRIDGSKRERERETGGYRRLHNEEQHNLYFSLTNIRTNK